MLTLSILLKKLKKEELEIHSKNKNCISYDLVNPILQNGKFENNTLYICFVSSMKKEYLKNPYVGFILIPDVEFEYYGEIESEVVVWNENICIEELFIEIQSVFRKEISCISSTSLMLKMLIKGKNLNEIINIGSRLLKNPIIVTDVFYKVMAMSDVDIDEPIWKFAKEYGYCSQEAINKFRCEGVAEKTIESEEPIFLNSGLAKSIPRIISKITSGDKVIGYIGVFKVDSEFQENNFEMTNMLSSIVAIEMERNMRKENSVSKVYERLIIDLLNGEISSSKILKSRLEAAKWSLKTFFCIVNITLSKVDDSIWFFDYFYDQLKECTVLSKVVKYKNSIVIVINYDKEEDYERERKSINKILKQNDIKGGISRMFKSLKESINYYKQAYVACEIGEIINEKSKYMYDYEDIAVFHMFLKLQNIVDLSGFCHPAYDKLIEYDELNSTDYCNTLYEYIIFSNSVSNSAEKLFIHRNTMAYRISKISQITGLDLNNGENIFRIYLSIKIKKWIKIYGL